jgi:hypothetical protein
MDPDPQQWKKPSISLVLKSKIAILDKHEVFPRSSTSLQHSRENIQLFKTRNIFVVFFFLGQFWPAWIRFQEPN